MKKLAATTTFLNRMLGCCFNQFAMCKDEENDSRYTPCLLFKVSKLNFYYQPQGWSDSTAGGAEEAQVTPDHPIEQI